MYFPVPAPLPACPLHPPRPIPSLSVPPEAEMSPDPDFLHWFSSGPLGSCLCILGLLGNSLSITIWLSVRSRLGSSSSTLIYFILIGVIDSLLLVSFFLSDSLPAILPSLLHTYSYCLLYSYVFFPVFFFFLVVSIWMIVAMTLDRQDSSKPSSILPLPPRYLLVVRGVRVSSSTTCIAVCGLLLACGVVNIPHFLTFHPVQMVTSSHKACNDDTDLLLEGQEWSWQETSYGASEGRAKYEFWVHCILLILLPWGSVALLNTSIIRQVASL